jgi:hypothetical protein
VHRELGRAGASPRLLLAMKREEAGFVGHAWVEVDGVAVLEAHDPADTYATVVVYDAAGVRVGT